MMYKADEALDWFSENGYAWELGRNKDGSFCCLIVDIDADTLVAESLTAPTWQEAVVDARIAVGEV